MDLTIPTATTSVIRKPISRELAGLQEQFDLVKYKSVYALSISLSCGVSDVKVSFEDLGFTAEESQIKKQALLKAPPIVVFPELRGYGHKLTAIKKDLQTRFMISGNRRWWFVLEPRIDELARAIDIELVQAAEEFKQEILCKYADAREDYRSRVITAFAGKFTDREQQDEVILRYISRFPSADDIADRFFVAIDGPLKISSLIEDAEVAEKAAVLVLRKQWQESIMQALQGSLREAEDEVFALVADLLERMENKPAGELSQVAKSKFNLILDRLNLLVDFNQSLEGINEQAFNIAGIVKATVSEYGDSTEGRMKDPEMYRAHLGFRKRLNSLREELSAKVDLSSEKEGHRALAKWLRI